MKNINTYVDEQAKTIVTTIKKEARCFCCNDEVVRGKAKCGPSDEFDIEVGKKLSFLRAIKKCQEKTAKEWKQEIKKTQQHLDFLKSKLDKVENKIALNDEKISDILGD